MTRHVKHPFRHRTRGQSMVELALAFPVLLLFMLIALDFGRVYLGYINLQNIARIAANFAANDPTGNHGAGSDYERIVLNDAKAINCEIDPATIGPTYVDQNGDGDGDDLGDLANVSLRCEFAVLTPVISNIVGSTVDVRAESSFPIKRGGVSGIPVGGGGPGNAPQAEFVGAPLSGTAPLLVTFTDQSTNAPTGWSWNFGNGTSTLQNPTHTYNAAGQYTVSLIVTNSAGSDTETKTLYITVTSSGPGLNADFTANPLSGAPPLNVAFTDASTGGPTTWAWDFDNNGTVDSTIQSPTHQYASAGTYTVSLTVGDGTTSDTETKVSYISVAVPLCVVPNVSDGNTKKVQATQALQNRGFVVNPVGGPSNWIVASQSPQGGLSVPCGSTVTINEVP